MCKSALLRFPEGGFIGVGEHEDGIRVHLLRDHRHQASLLGEIEITDVDRRLPPRVLTIGFLVVFFHQYQWGLTVELRGGSARSLSNDWLDALSSDIS